MARLAGPVVAAELGWSFMGMVDTLMVGRVSAEAIGAVSLGTALYLAVAIFGMGLLLGLDTLVSQAFGAGRLDDCHRSLVHGVYLSLILTPVLSGIILLSIPFLSSWGLNQEVIPLTIPYLEALVWSTLPLLLYTTFRCLGAQLAISVHNCPVLADTRFPMSIFKRTQRKYVKKAYRVRNWREYEAGLRNRGSLTVWISLTAGKLVNWDAPRPRRRKPGRQRKYSNHAIETAVTLGMVFHLSSRQSEGLLRSLFALMKLDNDVPDHTTISRRKAKLGKVPFYQDKQKTPLHILIDSSGLAVHAGQLRRAPNSRDYRKLHLCVDEQSGEVVAGELTSKRARDSSRVASLVGQIDSPISSARADTAYDAGGVYEAIENHSAHRSPRVLIPPRKGALLASGPASSRQRNRNIAAQARLGKRKWHTESGYSKRSKVETTFHRYKAIVGSAMRARGLAAQRVEARIGCKILNTMTALRMPDSEMIG